MMGRKDGQMQLIAINLETLVPENHLLRKINQLVDLSFIYDKLTPCYSKKAAPPLTLFCGFDLWDKVPDHSLFSQNRRRRFGDSSVLVEIFNHIVRECIQKGIVTGEAVVSDDSFVPANVASYSFEKVTKEVEQSCIHYLDALDEELHKQVVYKKSTPVAKEKTIPKSTTDIDCGYSSQENKGGFGYLA
ncbi:MAG: transposase [Defluviitaleaceae bacterium]|nr:transposase [Defluviitaleaceae bacterium]